MDGELLYPNDLAEIIADSIREQPSEDALVGLRLTAALALEQLAMRDVDVLIWADRAVLDRKRTMFARRIERDEKSLKGSRSEFEDLKAAIARKQRQHDEEVARENAKRGKFRNFERANNLLTDIGKYQVRQERLSKKIDDRAQILAGYQERLELVVGRLAVFSQ